MTSLAASALAALVLLAPASSLPARAQAAAQAAPTAAPSAPNRRRQSDTRPSDAKSTAAQPSATTGTASADQAGPAAAKEPHREGDRQGEAGREIGQRHFQPRAVPAAEGRRPTDGIAAACREQARFRPAGRDHRVRLVLDRRFWLDFARIHLSEPARGPTAPAISDRRHHRHQARQGRRRRAGNDEAAAGRGDRHAAGSRDLAGRHQCRAAQPRSGGDGKAGGRRRRAHSGRRRRCRAGRSAIFAAGHRARRERKPDGAAAPQGRRAASCRHFPALRGDARLA